jgi:hypothetical protein
MQRRRERESVRLTAIHLYNLTPKTNCGECGFPACLAFASQVIAGVGDLAACPYLKTDKLELFGEQLAQQQEVGIGVKREGFEKALEYLRGEIKKWDFETIAPSLGASLAAAEVSPAMELAYFREKVVVTHEDVMKLSGEDLDPWEKIFIYNYVIGGAVTPSGEWIGMESLPNSVSKVKSLKAHCEDRLAQAFAGRVEMWAPAAAGLGDELSTDSNADFAAEFRIFPMLAVRILWWDAEPSEGFDAHTKFLFDSRVLQTLDLESLLFACEQLTDRLMEAALMAQR